MSALRVHLFGRIEVSVGPERPALEGRRIQELLAFLLIHRGHPWPREMLADSIWGDGDPEQLRKGLRQSLWKLQSGADLRDDALLVVDSEFVGVNPDCPLWLDVTAFEAAHDAARGRRGIDLDDATAARLRAATDLYRGDLLEGWYVDWCLPERERLIGLHLAMLNKLSAWCAARGRFEEGLAYAHRALQHDPAHERSHRHLMRLHHLSGDRCAAIRQYRHCVLALQNELGVEPDARTITLFQQIAGDTLGPTFSEFDEGQSRPDQAVGTAHLVAEFQSLRARLTEIEGRIGVVLAGDPVLSGGADAVQTTAKTPASYPVAMPG